MLAHSQGGQLNIARIAASLDVAAPTAKRYLELLEDLLLIRSLRPWSANIGKRLVKSPKIYIRDSGLTHALLSLTTLNDLLGHPVAGASWEYRTSSGAEIDLVIEWGRRKIAIEIKRSTSSTLSKGFHSGCEDIKATEQYIVYPGTERFPVSKQVTAMPLISMMDELKGIK